MSKTMISLMRLESMLRIKGSFENLEAVKVCLYPIYWKCKDLSINIKNFHFIIGYDSKGYFIKSGIGHNIKCGHLIINDHVNAIVPDRCITAPTEKLDKKLSDASKYEDRWS